MKVAFNVGLVHAGQVGCPGRAGHDGSGDLLPPTFVIARLDRAIHLRGQLFLVIAGDKISAAEIPQDSQSPLFGALTSLPLSFK